MCIALFQREISGGLLSSTLRRVTIMDIIVTSVADLGPWKKLEKIKLILKPRN